jgi:hypothetical protein
MAENDSFSPTSRRSSNNLLDSARFGFEDRVREILISNPEQIDKRDDVQGTAVHVALQYGHQKIALLLLEFGVDPMIKDSNGKTAYDLAPNEQIKSEMRGRSSWLCCEVLCLMVSPNSQDSHQRNCIYFIACHEWYLRRKERSDEERMLQQKRALEQQTTLHEIPESQLQVIAVIGEGGFATVRSATWKTTEEGGIERAVALKELKG